MFGLYLFLVMTQKCRVIIERHDKEIAEYLQRKNLYKQFETDEIFKKNIPVEEHLNVGNSP